MVGAIAATIVDAVLTIGSSYLFQWVGYGLVVARVIAVVMAVIIGAVTGGATLFARPSGPLIPVLAAVLAVPASFVGDLIGIVVEGTLHGGLPISRRVEFYIESYTHVSVFGLFTLLLYAAVAFGTSAIRHLRRVGGPQNAGAPWGSPYGGQYPGQYPPQPQQPIQPPPPGYQQPGQQQPGQQQPGYPQPPYGQSPPPPPPPS
ncbi:hypothetical protein [Actinomadura sp. NBRC 104412]|uniref:hypothetical protein n=1 Tax=Actinomadura sp. NBRC 104412 TaxID=3032203 RepID=UPI002554BAFB|nr:hypothetical protein [Actinomadura sp. NBRC 104412]